jgi:hypothetical protein
MMREVSSRGAFILKSYDAPAREARDFPVFTAPLPGQGQQKPDSQATAGSGIGMLNS